MKTALLLLFGLGVIWWAVDKTVGYMGQATAVMESATAGAGCG